MKRENPFKKLGYPPKDVPTELKEKVMADVASAKLLMDMASLFTSNYKATMESLFKTKKNNNQ
jgi:hypothetical protein